MFKKLFSGIVLSLSFVCLLNSQTPQLINYQGILTDNAGAEITGTRNIQFLIYDAATSGSLLWSETQSVDVEDGLFNVLLGSVVTIPYELFEVPDRYLAIKVEADNEMLPRQRLTSVGYAFQSMNTHLVNFQHLPENDGVVNEAEDPVSWYKLRDIPAGFADGTDDVGSGGSGITQINGSTGLSITNPTGPTTTLELDMGHGNGIDADMLDGSHAASFATSEHGHWGAIWSGASSTSNGLYMQGNVPWAHAIILVQNTSNGPGVWGDNSGNGNGVRGTASGTGIGVFGACVNSGPGVSGMSEDGNGVKGVSTNSHGVWGETNSTSGAFAGYFTGTAGIRTVTDAGAYAAHLDNAVRITRSGWHGIQIDNSSWAGIWIDNAGSDGFSVNSAGRDGFAVVSATRDYFRAGSDSELDFRVTNDGTAYADGGWQGAADFAELIETDNDVFEYEPGDVLVISSDQNRAVTLSLKPYSSNIIGVYSTKPGFVGSIHPMEDKKDNEIPVAITGIVPCKVSTENGPIKRGDLLTSSGTPGYAMKATDPKIGTILGKALEALDSGKAKIEVLVILQ